MLVLCAVSAAGLAAASPAVATFAEPFPVSAGNTESPEVAVASDGDTVFAWRHFDGTNWRVQARFRSAAGVLSPIQTLSAAGQDAENLQLAVDTTGDAVMVWQRSDGATVRIEARTRSAAGVLSPVRTLSAAGQGASDPGLDVDVDGDAVFVWKLFDGGRASFRVETRALSAAGVLSSVQTVTPAGDFPRVGVDDDGDAVFVWLSSDGSNLRARTRGRSGTGTLSPVGTLSLGGQDAAEPQIAVDPSGDAVFAWTRFDGANVRIEARARSASGVLSRLQRVSPPGTRLRSPPGTGCRRSRRRCPGLAGHRAASLPDPGARARGSRSAQPGPACLTAGHGRVLSPGERGSGRPRDDRLGSGLRQQPRPLPRGP